MSTKGKSRNRKARADLMRGREAIARRKARAKSYARQAYDKPQCEETPLL